MIGSATVYGLPAFGVWQAGKRRCGAASRKFAIAELRATIRRTIASDASVPKRRNLAPALRETGIIATRQLAKRQLTWLRAMPERIVIDCLGRDPAAEMLKQLAATKAWCLK